MIELSPPFSQLPPAGEITDRIREAFQELEARPDHDPTNGRFVPGNLAAAKSLSRSRALWNALEPGKQELKAQRRAELAAARLVAPEPLLDAWAEISIVRRTFMVRMAEKDGDGPITTKGRTRQAYTAYITAFDREQRADAELRAACTPMGSAARGSISLHEMIDSLPEELQEPMMQAIGRAFELADEPGAALPRPAATPPRRENAEPVHDAVDELLVRFDGRAQVAPTPATDDASERNVESEAAE